MARGWLLRNRTSARTSGFSIATFSAPRSCKAAYALKVCCNCLVSIWVGLAIQGVGRALGVGEVRFTGQIRPSSQKVTYQIDIKRVVDRKLNIGIADGKAFVDGREIYFAKDLRVCLVAEANNDEDSSVRCVGERTMLLV